MNETLFHPYCAIGHYIWDPYDEEYVFYGVDASSPLFSDMVSELQWSSPPRTDRCLRPVRCSFKRSRRSTTRRSSTLKSLNLSDLIDEIRADSAADSSSSSSSVAEIEVSVADNSSPLSSISESIVEIEGVVAVDSSSLPYFDFSVLDSASEKTVEDSSLSFCADQEIEMSAWKSATDALVFGTFTKLHTPEFKVLEGSTDSSDSSAEFASSSAASSLSYFADRSVHVPPWKPAIDPFNFGTVNKGFLDHPLIPVRNAQIMEVIISNNEDYFSMTEIHLCLKFWFGLWYSTLDWPIALMPLFVPGGFCFCSQVGCENSPEIGNQFMKIQYDLGVFLCCSQGVCDNVKISSLCASMRFAEYKVLAVRIFFQLPGSFSTAEEVFKPLVVGVSILILVLRYVAEVSFHSVQYKSLKLIFYCISEFLGVVLLSHMEELFLALPRIFRKYSDEVTCAALLSPCGYSGLVVVEDKLFKTYHLLLHMLLTFCLRLVHAEFIWTELHSNRSSEIILFLWSMKAKLVAAKIHLMIIISDLQTAAECALNALLQKDKTDVEKSRSDLVKDKEYFEILAANDVVRLKGNITLAVIQIIKKPGGSLQDSFLNEGLILDKKIGAGQPKCIRHAKMLLAHTAMFIDRVQIYGACVSMDSMSAVAEIKGAEKIIFQWINHAEWVLFSARILMLLLTTIVLGLSSYFVDVYPTTQVTSWS